jgi:hypothetical protein
LPFLSCRIWNIYLWLFPLLQEGDQILIAVSSPAGYGTDINCCFLSCRIPYGRDINYCFPLLQDVKQILIAVSSPAGYETNIIIAVSSPAGYGKYINCCFLSCSPAGYGADINCRFPSCRIWNRY